LTIEDAIAAGVACRCNMCKGNPDTFCSRMKQAAWCMVEAMDLPDEPRKSGKLPPEAK
jgi:hypothetical protein